MNWYDKRFHSLNYELRKTFKEKVFKLSLDGGFTCPNRDGKIGTKGCLFCNERGSGDFTGSRNNSISTQIIEQKNLLSTKWPNGKYIAYFQNFTNTYASVELLKSKYYEALSNSNIVGLAIATRPDCLSYDVLELLNEINNKTYLWIELGLQTINEDSALLIRRGYNNTVFEHALNELRLRNINVVVHTILGLPYETTNDMFNTINYIAHSDIQGIKFHLLHILYNTDLYDFYMSNKFKLLSQDEYINLIVDFLELLPPNIVIHRTTGDAPKNSLFAPLWSANKRAVLNGIDKELKNRNSYQGFNYK